MLFSNRDLSKLIIPLLLQQALSVTVGMLDSVMVSSAGEAAVSGVSLVDTVNLLLLYLFSALANGGAVTISQSIGSKDHKRAKEYAKQLLWVVFAAAILLACIAVTFRGPLLSLIFGSISDEIMENAQIYFLFTAMSYPFIGLYNACAAIFRAQGNSKISLYTSLAMNLINICGNALLIYVFHWGAAGAAIATLFARMVGSAVILRCVCSPKNPLVVETPLHFRPQWPLIKKICQIGIPNGIENGMFQFGKVITQSLISTYGVVQIAANAAANPLTSLQYVPGTAIGFAMTVIVGRCIGAGKQDQAKYYTKKLMVLGYLSIIAVAVPMAVFARPLVGLYQISDAASTQAVQLLILHTIMVSTVWPLAFKLPNSFRAASDVKYPMIISIASMWIFRVGLSFVFGNALGLGILGVWLAMGCDWTFRAIVFTVHYLRGKWLLKYQT